MTRIGIHCYYCDELIAFSEEKLELVFYHECDDERGCQIEYTEAKLMCQDCYMKHQIEGWES